MAIITKKNNNDDVNNNVMLIISFYEGISIHNHNYTYLVN